MFAWGALLLAALSAAPAGGVRIDAGPDAVSGVAGRAARPISTKTFDVVHAGAFDGQPRLGPGRVTVQALGKSLTFGPPAGVRGGAAWSERRGWVHEATQLWYVAPYQFFADQPFARLVLTMTDRHDTSPATEPSDHYW